MSYLYALGFQIAVNDDVAHRFLAGFIFAALTLWTVVVGFAVARGVGRRPWWIAADLAVVCVLMLSTIVIAAPQWRAENQSLPTTLWATNPVLSSAIAAGPVAGGCAAIIVLSASAISKGFILFDIGRNAAAVIVFATGLVIGICARAVSRAQAQADRATADAAATAERERLARSVHDGVLQSLAMISRRGREIGGDSTKLADMAASQEQILREMLAPTPTDTAAASSGDVDVAVELRSRSVPAMTVSAPASAVLVAAGSARELLAAADAAIDNSCRHGGDDVAIYVLVEQNNSTVTVSIRDNGPGIASNRLIEAQQGGRLGVAQSIIGWMESIGGQAHLETDPTWGTEWELSVTQSAAESRSSTWPLGW